MTKMKTLTVSGQTYTVCDPAAVSFEEPQLLTSQQQKNARDNIGACDEKSILDKLCPAFTESGGIVACEPVAGYPLEVVSELDKNQGPYTSVKLTQCGKNLFDLSKVPITEPETAMAQIAKVTQNTIQIVTREGYTGNGYANTARTFQEFCPSLRPGDIICVNAKTDSTNALIWLSAPGNMALIFGRDSYVVTEAMLCSNVVLYGFNNNNVTEGVGTCTISDLQVEFGTAATAYEPYKQPAIYTAELERSVESGSFSWADGLLTDEQGNTYPLQPRQIPALKGTNVLRSSTGQTQVTGRVDPVAVMEKLTGAVAALNSNV